MRASLHEKMNKFVYSSFQNFLIWFSSSYFFYFQTEHFVSFGDMGLLSIFKERRENFFYANGVGSFLTLKISHGNVCCCIGIEGKMSSEREKNWINFFMSSCYKATRNSKKGSIWVKGKRKLLSFEWHLCKKRALIKFIIVEE